MKRYPDWDVRLSKAALAQSRRAHDWQWNNCLFRAAELIEAMTGTDLVPADIRAEFETVTDEDGALAIMHSHGWESVADAVSAFLPEIDVHDARRGDAVLIPGPHGAYLAIKTGRAAIGPADPDNPTGGNVFTKANRATHAWRVG